MIQVREVFQLRFGKAKEAIELAREGVAIERRFGSSDARILTDLTGEYYTLVLEADYENLAAFEDSLRRATESPEFREWYPRFAALARGGRREIYRVVGSPEAPRIDSAMVGERVVGS